MDTGKFLYYKLGEADLLKSPQDISVFFPHLYDWRDGAGISDFILLNTIQLIKGKGGVQAWSGQGWTYYICFLLSTNVMKRPNPIMCSARSCLGFQSQVH